MEETKPNTARGHLWSPYQAGIVALLFAAMAIAYMDRVNFSVVIPALMQEYHLSPEAAGILLSVFNWAVAVAFLFSGPLVDRFHPRRILPGGVALWSAATCMAGLSHTVPVLGTARTLLGLGESAIVPSASRLIAELFSKEQRGKAMGIYMSGPKVGLALGAPLASLILTSLNWQAVFFITGLISFLWLIPWFLVYRNGKEVIAEPEVARAPRSDVSWAHLFTYKEMWCLMLGQAGYLYVYFVFLTWLPSYLILERGMDVLKTGFLSSLPFLLAVGIGIFSGWLSDRWIQKGASLTLVRKTFIGGGFLLSTIFIILGVNIEAEGPALFFIFMSMGILGMTSPNINALPIDVSSRKVVSSVAALQNLGGNIGGALAPIVTGLIYSHTGSFNVALVVTGIIALIFGSCVHVFMLGRIEQRIGMR